MKSIKVLKGELATARALVKSLNDQVREFHASARHDRELTKLHRVATLNARKEAIAQKRLDRIAKMEARLADLKAKQVSPKAIKKANQKPSPVKLIKAA